MSHQLGIHVVYQELALCPNLTVAENICLNRASAVPGYWLMNRGDWEGQARQALTRLHMQALNLRDQVGRLSVAQQQMVEIAKAISSECRV